MSCPAYGKVLAELRYKQVIVTRRFASFVPDNQPGSEVTCVTLSVLNCDIQGQV